MERHIYNYAAEQTNLSQVQTSIGGPASNEKMVGKQEHPPLHLLFLEATQSQAAVFGLIMSNL